VVIQKMAFGPAPTGVRAGDVIIWVNKDMFRHTATARDRSFDVDLPPGKTARTVVRKPGPVSYYCKYHPGMTGRIVAAS
jgi:plastocyanin